VVQNAQSPSYTKVGFSMVLLSQVPWLDRAGPGKSRYPSGAALFQVTSAA
jgi:hypothetical protein